MTSMPAGTSRLIRDLSIQINTCLEDPLYDQPMQDNLISALRKLRRRHHLDEITPRTKKFNESEFLALLHRNPRFDFKDHFFSVTLLKEEAENVLSILVDNTNNVRTNMTFGGLHQLMLQMIPFIFRGLNQEEVRILEMKRLGEIIGKKG